MSDSEDDDRTWLQQPLTVASPGAARNEPVDERENNALPEGPIDEFEVIGLIGISAVSASCTLRMITPSAGWWR